jgi:hypothetical protein
MSNLNKISKFVEKVLTLKFINDILTPASKKGAKISFIKNKKFVKIY